MFGNRLGWSISAAIVVLTAIVLVMLARYGQPSLPGELGRNAASHTISMPVDPAGIVRSMPENFDPAPVYREAIAAYQADPELFGAHDARERLQTTDDPRVEKLRPVMDLLVKAAQSRQHHIFEPEEVINYDPDRPQINAIRKVGKTAIYLGLLHNREKRPDEARRLFEAVFALGAKLYHERLIWEEFDAALELLGDASQALVRLGEATGQPDLVSVYGTLNLHRMELYEQRVKPLHHAIKALNPYTADMVALALNGGDVLWRVEATLSLGRCKWSASHYDAPYPATPSNNATPDSGHFGDQQAARQALEQLVNDPNPRVRIAAQRGHDLTVEEFRKLR
jgi:tetratricopeptide (TPR) repeat protein